MTKTEFKRLVLDPYAAAPDAARGAVEGQLVDAVREMDGSLASAMAMVCWARSYFAAIHGFEPVHAPSDWFHRVADDVLSSAGGVPTLAAWEPRPGWSCYVLSGCFWASAWKGTGPSRDMMVCLATAKNLPKVRAVKMSPCPGSDPDGREVREWFDAACREMDVFKALAPGGSVKDLFVYLRDKHV